jgi:hypothetical protein
LTRWTARTRGRADRHQRRLRAKDDAELRVANEAMTIPGSSIGGINRMP